MALDADIVVTRLTEAFAGQGHDLLAGPKVHAAPDRREWVHGLLQRGLDSLTPEELDLLVYRAISTVGGVETFKYALVRFLAAVVTEPRYGAYAVSDAFVILQKLDHARFEAWPDREQAALELWALRRKAAGPDPEAEDITAWVGARRSSFPA